MDDKNVRLKTALISVVIAIIFITILTNTLSKDSTAANLLLDLNTQMVFGYPFTIQNMMWIIFFIGCGELFLSLRKSEAESQQTRMQLLPEDESTMLRSEDLGEVYKRANQVEQFKQCYLQRMISRTVLQFQSSRSVSQANALLNSSLELFQHEIDLSYNMLRYIVWLIPTLGFIGTVVGIAAALENAGGLANLYGKDLVEHSDTLLVSLTTSLGVAFYTTLLALILSSILVFLMHIAQEKQEMSLNQSGQYCLDNLINRLYEK